MGTEEEKSKLKLVQELAESGHGPSDIYILNKDDRPNSTLPLASDIPIIDLQSLSDSNETTCNKLMHAVTSWGIFQVVGHDLSPSFIDDLCNVSRQFFKQPLEVKEKSSNLKGGKFDLEGYGNDQVDARSQIIDWSDRIYLLVQPEDKRKLQYWPETPSSFGEMLNEYSIKTRKIADKVLSSLAKLLNLDENCFVNELGDRCQVFARFNYYPSCPNPDLVFGIKPHSDGSVITILLPDEEVEGLQVLKDGEWVKVPIVPNALVINMGNEIEVMSNGIFKSPVHRVVANSQERLSIVMFYVLESEKMLEPAKGLISETRPCLYNKMIVKDFIVEFFKKFAQGNTTIDWLKV